MELKKLKEEICKSKKKYFELYPLIKFCVDKAQIIGTKECDLCMDIKNKGDMYIHLKPDDVLKLHKSHLKIKKDRVVEKICKGDIKQLMYDSTIFQFFIPFDALENLKSFTKLIIILKKKNLLN